MTEARPSNYWIASNALYITLNANGGPDYLLGNTASGAHILCYMKGIDGLEYDAGHNYRRWPLSLTPTHFETHTAKYVYCAIPRPGNAVEMAVIVFPSERLDIYGKNETGQQIGSEQYYYIWLQGIISSSGVTGANYRGWTQHIDTGTLASDEAMNAGGDETWWRYSAVDETVTFLKEIVMDAKSVFHNLKARLLVLAGHELKGVATSDTAYTDSDVLVATPGYVESQYLSKTHPDTAAAKITFQDGLDAKHIRVTGSSGTTTDIDNSTQKEVGLDVVHSGVIGGILRVARNIITKTIQSLNFSGGDSLFGTGWQLTDDYGNGRSRLVVDDAVFRGKVTMNELEVRKLTAMGGNYVFSPAASIIEEVDYFDANGNVLGYEYVKVPWMLRLIPLSILGRYLSRKKWVRSTMSETDYANVKFYRCWLKADDGSTQTINTWKEGMLARCQTFDTSKIENGTHSGAYSDSGVEWTGKSVTNKLYWRAVVEAGQKDKESYDKTTVALNDGRKHNYIDLANYTENGVQLYLTNSDHVSAGDHIVCFGSWKDRQLANLVVIETVSDDAPAIKELETVGYTDGNSIDWLLDNKVKTRISPTTGNRFVAPEFIIETPNGNISLKVALDGINTQVKSLENGKNLLTLTSGWEGFDGAAVNYDEKNFGIWDTNSDLYSPSIRLAEGQSVCFSAYMSSDAAQSDNWYIGYGSTPPVHLSDLYDNAHISIALIQKPGDSITVDGTTYDRYYYVLNASSVFADQYITFNLANLYKLFCPQLEIGDAPTAFTASSVETSSQIHQTADEIDLSITNKLGQTGINIDGNNRTIRLQADKVTFSDSQGGNTDKISIDPATGTLNAQNAKITGGVFVDRVDILNEPAFYDNLSGKEVVYRFFDVKKGENLFDNYYAIGELTLKSNHLFVCSEGLRNRSGVGSYEHNMIELILPPAHHFIGQSIVITNESYGFTDDEVLLEVEYKHDVGNNSDYVCLTHKDFFQKSDTYLYDSAPLDIDGAPYVTDAYEKQVGEGKTIDSAYLSNGIWQLLESSQGKKYYEIQDTIEIGSYAWLELTAVSGELQEWYYVDPQLAKTYNAVWMITRWEKK